LALVVDHGKRIFSLQIGTSGEKRLSVQAPSTLLLEDEQKGALVALTTFEVALYAPPTTIKEAQNSQPITQPSQGMGVPNP
jgi:hypothetical protein